MSLKDKLEQVRAQIRLAEKNANREPGSVLLLAVSKKQPAQTIRAAHELGQIHFAESYLQEAQSKINQLKEFPLCWHFIGPIQSNKAKGIAQDFDWVHSISRLEIANALNEYRTMRQKPLQICLQMNLRQKQSKAGVFVEEAFELAIRVSQLPNLKLRGLMVIPPQQEQGTVFLELKQLMDRMNRQLGLHMDTLSMGMTDDFLQAIRAGSTIVRLGRAIFGER